MDKLDFHQKRRALEGIIEHTLIKSGEELDDAGYSRWPLYRSDPLSYFGYIKEGWQTQVANFFKELHKNGEQIVYVDICGTADGAKISADKSYAFSLKTPRNVKKRTDRVFIEGNVFSKKDFQKLIQELRHEGNNPALVTFEPAFGLFDQLSVHHMALSANMIDKERAEVRVAYFALLSNLRSMIEVLHPGGFILIGSFAVDRKSAEDIVQTIPREVISTAEQMGCSCEVNGARILIHKNRK